MLLIMFGKMLRNQNMLLFKIKSSPLKEQMWRERESAVNIMLQFLIPATPITKLKKNYSLQFAKISFIQ